MKLNLACGPNMFPHPGWVNYDRVSQTEYLRILREDVSPEMAAQWPDGQRRMVEYLRAGGKVDFALHDIREPLDLPDGCADLIYFGQAVEHLNRRTEVVGVLTECHRLLAPQGVLRITTPDMDRLLDAYMAGRMYQFVKEQPEFYATARPSDQLSYIMYGASGGECTTEHYEGHFHCYTRSTLAEVLTEAGFRGPYAFWDESGKSLSEEMGRECVDAGVSHSMICEAVK